MHAAVHLRTGRIRIVKNLAWLLRHAGDVSHFQIEPIEGTPRALLIAYLGETHAAREYRAEFASRRVLASWLAARRAFAGLPVYSGGTLRAYLGAPSNEGVRQSLLAAVRA